MGSGGRADEDRDMVSVIKERVEVGEYSIDPKAVATAMLARWSEVLVAAQSVGRESGELEALAGHDAA